MTDDVARVEVDVRRHVAEVWRSWVDPDRLTEWLGSVDRPVGRIGQRVRIDFGDGDFFDAEVTAVEAPHRLALRWRFLGIGQPDEVTVDIAPIPHGTWVTVSDSGLVGPDADAVRAGWQDFLTRLKCYCETGAYSRYGWSPEIVFSVGVATAGESTLESLLAEVDSVAKGEGYQAIMHDVRRGVRSLQAEVEHAGFAERTRLNLTLDEQRLVVEHTGWDTLTVPVPDRIALRHAWLDCWLRAVRAAGLVR